MQSFGFPTRCLIVLLASMAAAVAFAEPAPLPPAWTAVSQAGPWVVRIDIGNQNTAQDLSERFDVWRVVPREGFVEALITEEEYQILRGEGFTMALDPAETRVLQRLGIPLGGQGSGIPGFPCYRTVEETYATAESIVAAHPQLATWIDIGDSWEKTQDPDAGYDLRVLRLTNAAVSGPKPIFFGSFAIHAREYTTAELGTRFAEYLAANYGSNADVTWLLDHHEVHLLLQANPDGRKQAETGLFWRKNTNNGYCSNTGSRGADLNRNFDFEWSCCGGSSSDQCSDVYRGPVAASEPEIEAHQDYVRSIFPDQRGPDLDAPSPADATGVAIDVHSSGRLVLWPWGLTFDRAPNDRALATLGRKLAFFNGYDPIKITELTVADGSSADFYYGELGVAGIAFELGNTFFESCASFESSVVPLNIDSLLFAAKVARTPFLTPAGPEAHSASLSETTVDPGELVRLTATLDDTRFNNSNGNEPSQAIASAEAFVGNPPWDAGAVSLPMAASDGTFDQSMETVEIEIDTTGLAPGRHLLYVRGTDTAGDTGVVTAVFLEISGDGTLFVNGFETGDTKVWSAQNGG